MGMQDAESVERSREHQMHSPFHPIFANPTFRRLPQRAAKLNDASEWKIQRYFNAMEKENTNRENKSEISSDNNCKMFEDLHTTVTEENMENSQILQVLPESILREHKITKINSRWSV